MPFIRQQGDNVTINRLRVRLDGDQLCFALDDFVDLQTSPAYFLSVDSWQGQMEGPWVGVTETIHLPIGEQLRVLRHLEEAS